MLIQELLEAKMPTWKVKYITPSGNAWRETTVKADTAAEAAQKVRNRNKPGIEVDSVEKISEAVELNEAARKVDYVNVKDYLSNMSDKTDKFAETLEAYIERKSEVLSAGSDALSWTKDAVKSLNEATEHLVDAAKAAEHEGTLVEGALNEGDDLAKVKELGSSILRAIGKLARDVDTFKGYVRDTVGKGDAWDKADESRDYLGSAEEEFDRAIELLRTA